MRVSAVYGFTLYSNYNELSLGGALLSKLSLQSMFSGSTDHTIIKQWVVTLVNGFKSVTNSTTTSSHIIFSFFAQYSVSMERLTERNKTFELF